ncbi:MAG TPA: tripartite tricarboxylate transporter permease, partial [Gemmatimonadaceae bacterium]|nr:tripartite tricarboxylate transporter permease [Gemmatimonadaceae bacterium]
HIEGIVESGAANNSALAGAWIPAMVFGIPGDSITAIVIGVLYMKNLNPGPTLFVDNAASVYAVFLLFILANLLMLPFGWAAIKSFKQVLRLPRKALLPCILVFCILGAFAINNSVVGIGMMLGFGILGIAPVLSVLIVFQVARRAGNFAIQRPGREALFTVLPRTDKYKAKNFSDTFVYRLGDQVGAWSYTGMAVFGLGASGLAFTMVPFAALWLLLTVWLGRSYAKLERAGSGAPK